MYVNAYMMAIQNDTFFIAREIDDLLYERINGRSFHPNPDINISDLSYIRLLHYGFDRRVHQGEIVCNKHISDRVIGVFDALYRKRYQIESIRLIDDFGGSDDDSMRANNTSAFNYRPITYGTRLSRHALGIAIDINPLYNPYVKTVNGETIILPEDALQYADRARRFPHKITHKDTAFQVFKSFGFSWGGDWESLKDYQHFEIEI